MKNNIFTFLVVIIMVVLTSAYSRYSDGSIKGKVIPPDGASQVWAISASDTLKAAISQGSFEITNVKQGSYKVYIDAIDPYQDVVKDGVQVNEGAMVDLGEIQLTK
jgi:hypothetical protein